MITIQSGRLYHARASLMWFQVTKTTQVTAHSCTNTTHMVWRKGLQHCNCVHGHLVELETILREV